MEHTHSDYPQPNERKTARIYMRVSTDDQNLERQAALEQSARDAGFYIAGIYREKASGARMDRPELLRMIDDIQNGDTIIAERVDRLSRLPLADAERLVQAIKDKGARLAIPGLVDFGELAGTSEGTTKIVLEAVQNLLLRLALQMSRDDYEVRRERQRQGIAIAREAGKFQGRPPDDKMHKRVLSLRRAGNSIAKTAELAGCSETSVKRICRAAGWSKSKP